ncbi:hypothetical protein [Sporosarcina luteola]|uniref:hypothetical protein n=1 Tax=Sporosarcina luteola TaxID=582850 RepID=UPI00203E9996|nr:hypothetical protein [Sporosarcina luteola]MCM3711030.1 hypothetical protein [Sporosarcina luteola]
MNERTKRILMISVIGLSVTLLLLGFIVGVVDKSKEKKDEKNAVEDLASKENCGMWQYTSKEGESENQIVSNKEMKSEEVNENTEDNFTKNYLTVPDEVTKKPTQIDMFPEKYLDETKMLAEDFLTKFHTFNRKKPTEHLNSVEGVLIQSHIDYLRDAKAEKIEGMKDVEGIISRKVLSVEIKEPVAPTLIAISWDGVVVSEVLDSDGNVRKDTDIYSMMFEKDSNGKFQITDFYLNYDQKR